MCQPELCTQHPVTVKRKGGREEEEEGWGGGSFTLFNPPLIFFIHLNSNEASSAVNAVNVISTSCWLPFPPTILPQGRYSWEQ